MQNRFMIEALAEAQKAFDIGDVPVGAVIVKDDVIIGRGHNQREFLNDPTAHAEILAIKQAAGNLGGWRLSDCEMYVTVEPCPMCAGAIVLARIRKITIGTMDPKSGACGSLMNILNDERLNHYVEISEGCMREDCQDIIKSFFKKLRHEKGESR